MRGTSTLLAFNRGLIDPLALARIDIKRTALSAEIMTNWMPRSLGPMALRPGLEYLGSTNGDAVSRNIPFIYSVGDTAWLEATANTLRVWVNGAPIVYPSVSTTVTNGNFLTDLTGWTDADEGSAVSAYGSGGYLSLTGSGASKAVRRQLVSVAMEDRNVEHAIELRVTQGVLLLSIGSTAGGAEYKGPLKLRPGHHFVSITPSGDFYIQLAASTKYPTLVDSVGIAAAGALAIDTPWGTADLANLRWEQSADVVFVCDGAHRPKRIERWGTRSWSVVDFLPTDGPFRPTTTDDITLAVSALSGAVTITANAAVFYPDHVGALFEIESSGQSVSEVISGADQWTSAIRVTGVGNSRIFSVSRSGTFSATVTLQRSVGAPGDWADVATYTTAGSANYDDGLDNQIVYYRLGVKAGNWTSGSLTASLTYSAGSIIGVGQVTAYISPTQVNAIALKDFGGTSGVTTWREGQWSDRRGWPSALALYDGRLWFAGKDRINGSVSDAYGSFDDTVEGDSGPIQRSIGRGPVDDINWMLPLTQLVIGTEGSEQVARGAALDEPLTPSAFSLRTVSTQGSKPVSPCQVDTSGIFVQRNGRRIMELVLGDTQYTYSTVDLTSLIRIPSPVVAMAVQRQPDTRIHCVREDGKVQVLVYDRAEEVNCWVEVELGGGGVVEDVFVLPGEDEDEVYYVAKFSVGGSDKRYVMRFATEAEARGAGITHLADAYVFFPGPVTTVTGLSHLEGKIVCVWGNAKDLGAYIVSSGQITLTEEATNVTVGLPYIARFKSSRLIIEGEHGTVGLTQPRMINSLGLVLAHTHHQGLRFGQDFDHLDDLPAVERWEEVAAGTVHEYYEEQTIPLSGSWSSDSRLCLEAMSPRACTVMACVIQMSGNAK